MRPKHFIVGIAVASLTAFSLAQEPPKELPGQASDEIISELKESLGDKGQVLFQNDELKIVGPTETVTPGDLVFLKANVPVDAAVSWILGNSAKQYLPVENNRICVFSTADKGTYKFYAVVAMITEDGSITQEVLGHAVQIGDAPKPPDDEPDDDDPVDPPTPENEWVTKLKDLKFADRPITERIALANAFEQFSEKTGDYEDVTDFSIATMAVFRGKVGLNAYLEWRPQLSGLSEQINSLGLGQSSGPYKTIWEQIAEAIRLV